MLQAHFLLLSWICSVSYLMSGVHYCMASQKGRSACLIQHDKADCSHLSLKTIPPDLPRNITSLDMSHNRLGKLPAASLAPYQGLLHLDVNHNSITRLEEGLCQTLALLQSLNVEHNEVFLLKERDLSHCTNITWLNLASNRLKLEGEPFTALKSLLFLDVSHNKLVSAALGTRPQLPNLVALILSRNDISTLNKDDFSFLSGSSDLRILNLSYLHLKTITAGCFKSIARIQNLTMDGCNLSPQITFALSSELSGTAIKTLSLRKNMLSKVTNITFRGLEKTNLTFLDLSNSSISKIEGDSFQWLDSLETLFLEDNNIRALTKSTFQGLSSLKKLNLRHISRGNKHASSSLAIEDFSFKPLSTLESLVLEHNTIQGITEHTFVGLTGLHDLDMGWSVCTTLKNLDNNTFVSLAASPLRKLNLTGTAISRIGPGAFNMFRNLTALYLGFNFIGQFLTGQEFQGLVQVQEIYLSNNRQTITLTPTSFIHVPNLRTLMLAKALTSNLYLDTSPFSHLSKLTFVDLSNNNIANINKNVFEGLADLSVLKLQHNNLARLWKSANPDGPVLFLKGLRSLAILYMDYNGLDEIPVGAFSGLGNLRELNLGNNLLNSLKDTVFDGLPSLQVLHLQKNLITAVRPEVFMSPMRNLSMLFMDRNPFDCTCESILWFVTWLNKTNASVPYLRDIYKCNTPLAYFNHTIMDFDPLSCKDLSPFQALFILSSTAVISLIMTALLVRFHGWRIHFYWNILINRTLGFSDAKVNEGREFEYDAYVIHAEEDIKWVEKSLLPLENEKCAFCLEDRDSLPGMSRLESIVGNIRRSRKVLFVVTECLLNDHWCRRFKAHHVLHQVIEASRDSVLLVFLQDVQDYKLSCSLYLRRGMLRSRCILHWPVHKERVALFHQKLCIALGMTNRLQQ
ncbi:toll-like receptor 3 [Lampris incognitus]|uniref:toll-like receptor 3 n=1 Tax=Lampris incognitus TaxID=2546036 RepID=UPI0024B5D201|nr:toll-like receptor 3 [Lampris incognitus]